MLTTLSLVLLHAAGAVNAEARDPHSPAVLPGPDIHWEATWDGAFEKARTEGKVVFLAVNMDGEQANEFLARKVYAEKSLVELTHSTVSLVASQSEHAAAGKACKRFGGLICDEHKAVDIRARSQVLKAGVDGQVISPQHVFLTPSGEVILSVAYGVQLAELEWCFVTAIRSADPKSRVQMPKGARAPKRLIMGGVFDPSGRDGASRPLTDEELEAVIKEIRSRGASADARTTYFRVLATDHPEAVEVVKQQLQAAQLARRPEIRTEFIRAIGAYSPAAFWAAVEGFLKDPEESVRNEAAVALEQLAAPKSVKALRGRLAKEKSPSVRKNLLRALGTAGAEDKNVRKQLLKSAVSEKEPLLRRNAVLALGSHLADEDAAALLQELLGGEDGSMRQAAALAFGFSRDAGRLEALRAAQSAEPDAETKSVLERCVQVLEGGDLKLLAPDFERLLGDTVPRQRFFEAAG